MAAINVKVEWNSKAVINLIREMATQEEAASTHRIFAYARSAVPIGKYGQYRYPSARVPYMRRKKGELSYRRGKTKKDWQERRAGRLFRSIKKLESKYGKDGGKLVFAGDMRLTYYAHFVEFGTVYFKQKRSGYKFLRNAINRERRVFSGKIQSALASDMR
jgi:uncharacterized protein YaiE (UPF0345 family)